VVVWGSLNGEPREERNVIYIHATRLIEWLDAQPPKLSDEERRGFVTSVRSLALART